MEEKSIMTKSGKLTSKRNKLQHLPAVSHATRGTFPKVFDAIPLAVISVDWKGQIQYMNRAAKSMLGEPDLSNLEEWPQLAFIWTMA